MALAKIKCLALLPGLFTIVWITDAVAFEAVEQGVAIGASDAFIIQSAIEAQWLVVQAAAELEIPAFGLLGSGELSSIALALSRNVDWLLIDDAAARKAAHMSISASHLKTEIKGTLGVLVSASQCGLLTVEQTIAYIRLLRARPDVWISHSLCDRVIDILYNP